MPQQNAINHDKQPYMKQYQAQITQALKNKAAHTGWSLSGDPSCIPDPEQNNDLCFTAKLLVKMRVNDLETGEEKIFIEKPTLKYHLQDYPTISNFISGVNFDITFANYYYTTKYNPKFKAWYPYLVKIEEIANSPAQIRVEKMPFQPIENLEKIYYESEVNGQKTMVFNMHELNEIAKEAFVGRPRGNPQPTALPVSAKEKTTADENKTVEIAAPFMLSEADIIDECENTQVQECENIRILPAIALFKQTKKDDPADSTKEVKRCILT